MEPNEAIEFFKNQGVKQPGDEGFWEVWGARPQSLRPGDILISRVGDTLETEVDFIVDTFKAESLVRVGFVNQDGERLTVGIGAPIALVRWGTHATLVDHF